MPESPPSDAATRLRTFLRSDPPAGVTALDPAAQAQLADLLDDARRQQAASLETAFAATIKHLPFPVRGIAKKLLWG